MAEIIHQINLMEGAPHSKLSSGLAGYRTFTLDKLGGRGIPFKTIIRSCRLPSPRYITLDKLSGRGNTIYHCQVLQVTAPLLHYS